MNPPVIAPEIYALRPDFAALSILVAGARNGPSDPYGVEQLRLACEAQEPEWAEAHLDAWRDAYPAQMRIFDAARTSGPRPRQGRTPAA